MKRFLLVAFFLMLFTGTGFAQADRYGMERLKGLIEAHEHTKPLKYKSQKQKPKNETEFMLATGFNVYKAFFSSQDNPSCVFYPSCSSYSVEAFRQKGFFRGALITFDRLSRCHHFVKPGQYIFDPAKERYYDPLK